MTALLRATALRRTYPVPGSRSGGALITAVDGVDLDVEHGRSVAIVGRSGAGKSTLTRLLLALERPDSGEVVFDGRAISGMSGRDLRPLRRRFQAVFQDPSASLNPHLKVGTIVAEPLVAHGIGSASSRSERVRSLLEAVDLPRSATAAYPSAFSAGERQRIAIARALSCEPELLILDEPVASLDATVTAQILRLVGRLRRDMGLSLVVVSHDLDVASRICDRVLVMDGGRIVERGSIAEVLRNPEHPATRRLVDAASSAQEQFD